MAFWNRNKANTVDVPPEVQNYYQAESREKTWLAWVLGLVTLLVTIVLALALFYGGRWVYRKIRNDPPAQVTTVQTEQTQNTPAKDTTTPQAGSDTSTTSTTTAAPATPPTTATSSTSTTTPSTAVAASTSNLTKTGPTDTLAIFVAVTVLAYVAHRRYLTHDI